MAYNYSPWLLDAKKELVDYLLNLSREGAQARVQFKTYGEAENYRLEILELLANLVRNRPEMAALRAPLRTMVDFEQDHYVVYIGVGLTMGTKKLRGAKPRLPVMVTDIASSASYIVSEKLVQENYDKVWKAMVAAAITHNGPKAIILEVPPPTEIMAFMAKELSQFGFEVVQNAPKFILNRVTAPQLPASAIVAPPSDPLALLPDWMRRKPSS